MAHWPHPFSRQSEHIPPASPHTSTFGDSLHERINSLESRLRRYGILPSSPARRTQRTVSTDRAHRPPPATFYCSFSTDGCASSFDQRGRAGLMDQQSTSRSTSVPPASLSLNGSQTSPMPRRPSPGVPFNNGAGGNTPAAANNTPARTRYSPLDGDASTSPDAHSMAARLQQIKDNNGKLMVNGRVHAFNAGDLRQVADLGHGTCGQVLKMQHIDTGFMLAVKQMRRSGNNEEMRRVMMDLEVVQRCDCAYIVNCYGYLITESELWICMELMSTCLGKLLRHTQSAPVPEPIIGRMTVSIVRALDYLKTVHKIMHRDVKPSNILLDSSGRMKMCDFGISGTLINSIVQSRTGCVAYMAPERIEPHRATSQYGVRADVWSLGVTLVELARGHFPYAASSDFEMISRIVREPPPVIRPSDGFTPMFCEFVAACLAVDVNQRPNYTMLMEYEFFTHYAQAPPDDAAKDVAEWFRSLGVYDSLADGAPA